MTEADAEQQFRLDNDREWRAKLDHVKAQLAGQTKALEAKQEVIERQGYRIAALETQLVETLFWQAWDNNRTHRIEHDGFEGNVIGYYVTREGKRGVVLQQTGTRVVHVYSEKWIKP